MILIAVSVRLLHKNRENIILVSKDIFQFNKYLDRIHQYRHFVLIVI